MEKFLIEGGFPLSGTVTFPDGSTDTFHVPQTSLDWTVSPKIELGYILPKRQWDEKPPFCYGRKSAQYGEAIARHQG